MVDFLRNAVSYLSGGSGGPERGSEFVGQVVDLGGGLKLKVKKVIAEGKRIRIVCIAMEGELRKAGKVVA